MVPNLNKIGTYKGIFEQAFNLVETVQTGVTPGVVANSGKNYAATGLVGQTNSGTPTFTVNYQNSNVKEFTPSSLAYGCVLQAANAVTALPVQCIITFTGYIGPDVRNTHPSTLPYVLNTDSHQNTANAADQVCSKTFQYLPSSETGSQQMAVGTFPASCAGKQED